MDEFFITGGYEDNDGDGSGGEPHSWSMCGETPSGVYPDIRGGDCDDEDATVFPDAPELCDGIDNDCDERSDELGAGATPSARTTSPGETCLSGSFLGRLGASIPVGSTAADVARICGSEQVTAALARP